MLCITVERGYHSPSLFMLKEVYHNMVLSDLKIKLAQFEEELEQTQTAIKTIMTDKQTTPIDHVYCYFTQSIMINEQAKENVLIIGSLHIHNKSIHNKKDPTILIKITADTNFHFIGKFKSAKQEQQNFTFQRSEERRVGKERRAR